MSAQKNTLFKYFPKSPAASASPGAKGASPAAGTPKTSRLADSPSKTPKRALDSAARAGAQDSPKSTKSEFSVSDLVWAKLDSYPWWPSLVCNDPDSDKYQRGGSIHVQFFDNPPTRSWVKLKMVEKYGGGSGKPSPVTHVKEWQKACEEADKALKMSISERQSLIVNFSELDEDKENATEEDTSMSTTDGNDSKKGLAFQLDSEDSGDEFKPKDEEMESASGSEESEDDNASEEETSDPEEPDTPSPVKSKKRKRPSTSSHNGNAAKKPVGAMGPPQTPSVKKKSLAAFSASKNSPARSVMESSEANSNSSAGEGASNSWAHLKYEFLKPEKIRDANKHRPDHPDYNPRTLSVPEDFKKNLTPAMRQWWEMKSKHYDCVLFFKVGKFYELYHMDAVIGCTELELSYMKGDFAHSGFPEKAYGRFSASLIDKGYKVARVEQTETPEMMNERVKHLSRPTKFDKVVKREICAVTSRGTRVFSAQDGEPVDTGSANYLLAICEEDIDSQVSYGVCFIDTSIGTFHLGQFTDDRHCSRLLMLLAHHPPVHVLYERNNLSERTQQLLNSQLTAVLKETLAPELEFWSASKTLTKLAEGNYFNEEGQSHEWPEALKMFISDVDSLGLSPAEEYQLAVRSLGAITWYLSCCHLDQQLLSMQRFENYLPVDSSKGAKLPGLSGRHMILDGVTLKNLDVLKNKAGGLEGTLLNSLDQCCTPFGRRLLHQWICAPLTYTSGILSRQVAISELLKNSHIMEDARGLLAQLPDLERLLSKIHAQGNAVRSKTHPDSRAIFYEDEIYSKKKIMDFIGTLEGFKKAHKIADLFEDGKDNLKSDMLLQVTCTQAVVPNGTFPDLEEPLRFFENAFDHDEAQKEGRIIPSTGVDPDYDSAVSDYDNVKKELDAYLKAQCSYFGCKVVYFGSDKNRFQLEVPEHAAKKAGNKYELKSQKKGFKRFWTPETKDLLARMMQAEEAKTSVLKDLNRRIFAQFSSRFEIWNTAVKNLAVLDVLLSLAEYARKEEGEICVPVIAEPSKTEKPFVCLKDGRHPCLSGETLDSYVPNDTVIGADGIASVVLVTGPNMGGKSTLMRQAGLLLIMAHMGCHIPARECEFSPVDRIFTRLGANDDIMAGESTFFVELSETSAILHHATKHSLVLVDELGRGTSTYDGTAIAAAVVKELASLSARTLFSTHYHTLVDEFKNSDQVTLGHMACMVEDDNEEGGGEETVTFLYKFSAGACPKSYGFNAARLAGVPAHITRVGRTKAAQLEKECERRRIFRALCGLSGKSLPQSEIKSLLSVV
ncbi:DNA mismatch repair protein Msh6-like [Thrips palmi]|uniref:DNA mismatch repair protein n=1 Tax=Thrips palmi TaxID=161013 RepID=A0A6P8YBM3_THRPL|nr:DNA mismatch repair protein Msh6-like [Thrips palmi]